MDLLMAIPSRTLRTLRSHFRKHEDDLHLAKDLWNDYHGGTHMQNGPVKALKQALMRLRFEIKPDLQVMHAWGKTVRDPPRARRGALHDRVVVLLVAVAAVALAVGVAPRDLDRGARDADAAGLRGEAAPLVFHRLP